jgi:hypothetical protein
MARTGAEIDGAGELHVQDHPPFARASRKHEQAGNSHSSPVVVMERDDWNADDQSVWLHAGT